MCSKARLLVPPPGLEMWMLQGVDLALICLAWVKHNDNRRRTTTRRDMAWMRDISTRKFFRIDGWFG